MPAPDPAELRALAVRLAEDAGRILTGGLGRARALVETKSTGTDMVTEMDRASEAFLVDALRRARPGDGVLGEEGADDPGTTGTRWILDPLDGTTNYLYALPAFSVSIGVEHDGEVVAGAVVNPVLGETFSAHRGGGATCNDRALTVAGAPTLATALVATGFGYAPERRVRQAEIVAAVIGRVRDVRRFGSAALDLCGVAAGRTDCYFERGCWAWDYSAGGLIAAEAGAVVGDLAGGPPSNEMTLAAPPHLVDDLRALLLAAGADADY